MKRIDDKIKEIEKKDKRNRIIFIIVVAVVAAWYIVVTQKSLKEKTETIVGQDVTISEQLDSIKKVNVQLEKTIATLQKSQTPTGFWQATKDEGSTISYIDYVLHTGIPEAKPEWKDESLELIKNASTSGKTVWLFCGDKSGTDIASRRVAEVVYRKDDDSDYSKSVPKENDILKNTSNNRNTYRNFSNGNTSGPNNDDKAWPRNSHALVLQVETAGDAVFIQIKF